MDVSLTEGTAMPRSAPAVRSLCHSKVAFPTELNAPCPFPAFPSYRENWHCGPCPLCQLAKSLEGRCSVSDITMGISPSFLRRALPWPLVARELAPLSPRLPWPSHFTLTLEEAVQPPLLAGRDALPLPPPCCLSFSPFRPIWPMKVSQTAVTQRRRENKRLEKKNPVNVWFDFQGKICYLAKDILPGF